MNPLTTEIEEIIESFDEKFSPILRYYKIEYQDGSHSEYSHLDLLTSNKIKDFIRIAIQSAYDKGYVKGFDACNDIIKDNISKLIIEETNK